MHQQLSIPTLKANFLKIVCEIFQIPKDGLLINDGLSALKVVRRHSHRDVVGHHVRHGGNRDVPVAELEDVELHGDVLLARVLGRHQRILRLGDELVQHIGTRNVVIELLKLH